jgi:4-oxalmesaconate hydratase
VIIDCHGHYTTAPESYTSWREAQRAAFDAGEQPPPAPHVSDDEIRESIEGSQLRLMRERGIDLTVFSPRASAMGHHIGDEAVSSRWAQLSNDLIARVVELYPDSFIGVCQLPQSPGVPIAHSVAELRRCVDQLGFVWCNLNPDPSGGHWTSPPLTDKSWYPFYEAMVELDVPAMVHVSAVTNAAFHATGSHYLNADTTAFMQLVQADLFTTFPDLRLVIPHGGGAVPYHWGRYRGLAMRNGWQDPAELLRNVFFDTCVYHQPGIDLLTRVVPVENILFASEMVGAVRGIDPETGHYFDDTKRYVDAAPGLSTEDKRKIFEANARRVYPRLAGKLPT